MEYFTGSSKISSKTQYFQEMPKALFTEWQGPGMNSLYLIHQYHSHIVWFRTVWFAVLPFFLCSFMFVGYLFFCVYVCVSVRFCFFVRWPAWWKFVFSGNLPQCCVLIELLYCGLMKFFVFIIIIISVYWLSWHMQLNFRWIHRTIITKRT